MNAIQFLRGQHRVVEMIFELIESSQGAEDKVTFARDLAHALAGHAAIEERILYPALMAGDTEALLREAVNEHLAVERPLADILQRRVADDSFDALIKVLKAEVEHHVEEEEDELFPRVQKDLPEDLLAEMGARMEALFAELEKDELRLARPQDKALFVTGFAQLSTAARTTASSPARPT